jgi:hypothetical protein
MKRIAYWSHFTPGSRSAAGQRMRAFLSRLNSDDRTVILLGGGFQSSLPTWWRLLREVWATLVVRASLHIISLPPYRSALTQMVLLGLSRRHLIIDQRDVVLDSASKLERLIERLLLWRADALIVTTHAQHRAMARRYKILPRVFLIRNGASEDIAEVALNPRHRIWGQSRPRVLYQGLVGGKKLSGIAARLAQLGCDFDLAVFLDSYSSAEIEAIRRDWRGPGTFSVHADLDAPALIHLMDRADIALNPVPDHMDYAFTVKTADYALRGLPQLVIGSRRSVSRRIVERCRLGYAIDRVENLDEEALRLAIEKFRVRKTEDMQVFRRETHASRLIQLVREIER